MRNLALFLKYDGTAYHGWQVQKNACSVAQTLEEAAAGPGRGLLRRRDLRLHHRSGAVRRRRHGRLKEENTMDQNRRVVVTGLGIISPLGCGLTASWQGAKEGKCGIGPITLYDTEGQKVKLAGEAHGFDAENYMDKRESRKMDRCSQLAIAAAQEAFQMSGLDMEKEDPIRCGVLVSSGIGGLTTIQNECLKGNEKGWDRVSPYFIPMSIANMSAGHIAIQLGFQGMCSCSVTACASGTNAIGDAMRCIRHGYADVMLCGGTEASITPLGMGGFTSLKALCTNPDPARASIPFDKERSGFVMGEGAGMLMLESYEHAKARGAVILGEVAGYGATCDAHHITAPDPTGTWPAACIQQAQIGRASCRERV